MNTIIFNSLVVFFFVLVLFVVHAVLKRLISKVLSAFSSIKASRKSKNSPKKKHSLLFVVLELIFDLLDAFLF